MNEISELQKQNFKEILLGMKDVAGYAMSTLEEYRRKGAAMAGLNACISLAKNKGLNYAVLYSSKLDELLYKKLGFDQIYRFQEWYL